MVFESHCERRKRYVFSFVLNVASDVFAQGWWQTVARCRCAVREQSNKV